MGRLLPRLLEKPQQWCTTEVSAPWTDAYSLASSPLLTHLVLGLPLEDAAGGFWHTVIPQYPWGLVQEPQWIPKSAELKFLI